MKKIMTGILVLGVAAASQAAWTLLDNFDSYATGSIGASPNTTAGTWTGVFDGTGNAYVDDLGSGNKAIGFHGSSGSGGWRGIEADLTSAFGSDYSLANGATATYFFQMTATSIFKTDSDGADWDVMIGLSDNVGAIDNVDSWQDFAVMPYVSGAAATPAMNATGNSMGAFAVTPDTTYNVWLVVDNNTKLYNVYASTGTDAGTLILDNCTYRNGKGAGALEAISFMSHADNEMRIDNVYADLSGANTTYAIPEPATIGLVAVFGAGMLVVRRRFII